MRKAEARGSIERHASRRLARALKLSAAFGVGLLLVSGAVRAQENEDDDKTFEEKIIEGFMKGIGGTNMDNTGIDYRERSPLVVPPKLDLPPPAATAAEVKPPPNWPKDPDEARRKAQIAARKKAKPNEIEAARPLSPSELNVAKTAPSGGRTRNPDWDVPGGEPGQQILSPSQLGFDGRFSSIFGGNKAEVKEFKAEPPRESLTQPPPGYQTPSAGFAYGTGPKESLNKEYDPAAGKYGDK